MFSSLRLRLLSGLCLSALAVSSALADDGDTVSRMDPVVVSATRLPTPESEVASSVTVITAQEIEAKQLRTMPDVLREVPGLNIVQTGGPGGMANVFMRGTNANHTKVLVDGVEYSDPSSINGAFDFSSLLTQDIERVEVLRGPQSGLYGSDAIGGVINIITKKGDGPLKMNATVEGGSFGTFNQAVGARGSEGRFGYALDVVHDRSTSIPVTPGNLMAPGTKAVDNLMDNRTVSTRFTADLTDSVDASLVARATQTALQFTDDYYNAGFGGMVPDSEHSYNDARSYYTRGAVHQALLDGRFDYSLGLAYTNLWRRATDHDQEIGYYRGTRLKADWQGNYRLMDGQTVTGGLERERKAIDDSGTVYGASNAASAHVYDNAGFIQLQSDWGKRVEDTISIRYDDNSRFGSKTTYRFAPALLIPETGTKLKTSFGTGFKAPELDQLYHTYYYPAWGSYTYANPNLKPETSIGFDLGFEQAIGQFKFGSTYFHNKIKNLIDSVKTSSSTYQYVNIASAEMQGAESFIAFQASKDLTLRTDYTYTLAENAIKHETLNRRPTHKASVSGTWKATQDLSLTSSVDFVGSWMDADRFGNVSRMKGSGYVTANIAANYALTEQYELFGRITNLLDKRIENPVGFEQPGIGAFAGVKASF